jgi:REP element-mobilizing transposase RayT
MSATFYRRGLPHIRTDGAIYFVTWRLRPGQIDLSEHERDRIADALRHFGNARYVLHAYVIMNDHVHILVQILSGYRLEDVVSSWKSFTANRLQRDLGRTGAVWQDEYFDRAVRDDAAYDQKRGYILNNPWKRWPDLGSYRWVWAIGMDLLPAT